MEYGKFKNDLFNLLRVIYLEGMKRGEGWNDKEFNEMIESEDVQKRINELLEQLD